MAYREWPRVQRLSFQSAVFLVVDGSADQHVAAVGALEPAAFAANGAALGSRAFEQFRTGYEERGISC